MIRKLLRMLRIRHSEDDELAFTEERPCEIEICNVSPERAQDLESLRDTVRLLRSIETLEAPRSFAVNRENLARQGYSQEEISRILESNTHTNGFGAGGRLAYVPMAIAALSILGVAVLSIPDITEFATSGGQSDDFGFASQFLVRESDAPNAASDPRIAALPSQMDIPEATVQTVAVEKERLMAVQDAEAEKEVIVVKEAMVEVEEVVEIEAMMMMTDDHVDSLPTPRLANEDGAMEVLADSMSEPSPNQIHVATPANTQTPTWTLTPVPAAIIEEERLPSTEELERRADSEDSLSTLRIVQIALVLLASISALVSIAIWRRSRSLAR